MTEHELELLDKSIAALESNIEDAKQRMSEARKEGDLRENEEYSSAENDLFRFKKELAEKQERRRNATVVSKSGRHSERITESSIVSLQIGDRSFSDLTFTTSDPVPFSSIAVDSRLATLLMGKCKGDTFSYIDNVFRRQEVVILEVS